MKHIVKQGDVALVYEGTPEEIATYVYYEENGIDINVEFLDKKELIYDQDEAIEFIQNKIFNSPHLYLLDKKYSDETLRFILDADEDYMRSKGIITEE